MSRLRQQPKVETSVTIDLTESEIRALDALAGYGIEPFLEIFYKHMGRHYLQPHEDGLRSLFKAVQTDLPAVLRRADAARTAFVLANPVIRSKEEHEALLDRVRDKVNQSAKANAAPGSGS